MSPLKAAISVLSLDEEHISPGLRNQGVPAGRGYRDVGARAVKKLNAKILLQRLIWRLTAGLA